MTTCKYKYKRVLLKLSGEALAGKQGFGIDDAVISKIAGEVAAIAKDGVQTAIVIGGGNFIRGAAASGVSRSRRRYGDARDGHQLDSLRRASEVLRR